MSDAASSTANQAPLAGKRRGEPVKESFVPRVISFIVLLAIILLVGAVFFQVMAQFIVPLFLACVLLVVFQPLHSWILQAIADASARCRAGHHGADSAARAVAADWLGWNAYVELHRIVRAAGITPQ